MQPQEVYDAMLELIKEYSEVSIDRLEFKIHRKPTHGSCCTCQKCGHYHDECVCIHNQLVEKLLLIQANINNEYRKKEE